MLASHFSHWFIHYMCHVAFNPSPASLFLSFYFIKYMQFQLELLYIVHWYCAFCFILTNVAISNGWKNIFPSNIIYQVLYIKPLILKRKKKKNVPHIVMKPLFLLIKGNQDSVMVSLSSFYGKEITYQISIIFLVTSNYLYFMELITLEKLISCGSPIRAPRYFHLIFS